MTSAEEPGLVAAHRHYVIQEDGSKLYIGPNFCTNAATDQGFAAFHQNVHAADISLDVWSEGCQQEQ